MVIYLLGFLFKKFQTFLESKIALYSECQFSQVGAISKALHSKRVLSMRHLIAMKWSIHWLVNEIRNLFFIKTYCQTEISDKMKAGAIENRNLHEDNAKEQWPKCKSVQTHRRTDVCTCTQTLWQSFYRIFQQCQINGSRQFSFRIFKRWIRACIIVCMRKWTTDEGFHFQFRQLPFTFALWFSFSLSLK